MGSLDLSNDAIPQAKRSQVTVLAPNNQLLSSMTILRDRNTEMNAFVSAFEKVARQLIIAGKNTSNIHHIVSVPKLTDLIHA